MTATLPAALPPFVTAELAAGALGLDLETVERWADEAPPGTPGAPLGRGVARRWETARLVEWSAACAAWERGVRLPDVEAPVTTWRNAALLLGVSEDTLKRRREQAGVRARPWWPNGQALREWWVQLSAPPKLRRVSRR